MRAQRHLKHDQPHRPGSQGHPGRLGQPHRLPGAVPGRRGGRHHRGRHRAGRSRGPGPYAEVPNQKAFTKEPYGLGVNADHVDFVRFVNARLQQMRTDGQWKTIYNTWLREPLGPAPAPPKAVYGRNP